MSSPVQSQSSPVQSHPTLNNNNNEILYLTYDNISSITVIDDGEDDDVPPPPRPLMRTLSMHHYYGAIRQAEEKDNLKAPYCVWAGEFNNYRTNTKEIYYAGKDESNVYFEKTENVKINDFYPEGFNLINIPLPPPLLLPHNDFRGMLSIEKLMNSLNANSSFDESASSSVDVMLMTDEEYFRYINDTTDELTDEPGEQFNIDYRYQFGYHYNYTKDDDEIAAFPCPENPHNEGCFSTNKYP